MKKKKAKVKKEKKTESNKNKKFPYDFESQVDIIQFLESYLTLDENNTSYCPICHGSQGSLRIDKEKRTFSCSVCGISGGILLFLMLIHQISIKQAVLIITRSYPVNTFIPAHILM